MILSNVLNDKVDVGLYQFDHNLAMQLALSLDSIDLGIKLKEEQLVYRHRSRNKQTNELLARLQQAIHPSICENWLVSRGFNATDAYSIDYDSLGHQDLLDLYLYPDDHILDEFGEKPVKGPVFLDERNNKLLGVCVRNLTMSQDYAAAAKYTISNYGWFLYGYDLYDNNDEVFIVEGVFDALAMRKRGYNAIAVATAYPSAFQLACLMHKFHDLKLCLDNDFWGRAGAYIVSNVAGFPIYLTDVKDPGAQSDFSLNKISRKVIQNRIQEDTIVYNKAIENGYVFERPLPYNQ